MKITVSKKKTVISRMKSRSVKNTMRNNSNDRKRIIRNEKANREEVNNLNYSELHVISKVNSNQR